jgi:Flp pilus assembly pilin Flp
MNLQKTARQSQRGQALAENALVLGLVSVAAILALFMMGDGLQGFIAAIGKTLGSSPVTP